jgi:dynactin complex subunit
MQSPQKNSISDIRKFQINADEKLQEIILALDEQATLKQPEYKECEELSLYAAKLSSRWKRLTSLTMEALIELENEVTREETEQFLLDQGRHDYEKLIEQEEQEVQQLEQVAKYVEQYILKLDNSKKNNSGAPDVSILTVAVNSTKF